MTGVGTNGRRSKRGQALVELAISVPLLLLILLGTVDFGRVFFDYIQLRSAVREGAGYGALKPTDIAGMKARVLSAGVPTGTTAFATCTGSCTTVGATGEVVVTANSTFRPVTLGFFSWLGTGGSIPISVTAKMRVLS